MIKQKAYKVCIGQHDGPLLFKCDEGSFRLEELNAQGKRLVTIIECRENVSEIMRKRAIFEYEEKEIANEIPTKR